MILIGDSFCISLVVVIATVNDNPRLSRHSALQVVNRQLIGALPRYGEAIQVAIDVMWCGHQKSRLFAFKRQNIRPLCLKNDTDVAHYNLGWTDFSIFGR